MVVETYDLTESPHDDRGKQWPPVVVERHLGPGPHPSGSPQDVHAGKGAGIRETAMRVMKDEWDTVDNVFEIEPNFNGWVLSDGTILDIGPETHLNSLEQLRYHVEGWENAPQIRMFDAVVDEGFVRTGVIWGDTPILFVQMHSYPPREARESVDALMAAFPDASFSWELLDRGRSGTDRHEFRRLSGVRVNRSVDQIERSESDGFILRTARQIDEAFAQLERLLTGKHYGPGPHPGTGTEQEVHAGDGGWRPRSGEIAIDHGEHGRIVRVDSRNDDGTVNVTVLSGLDRLSRYKNVNADDLEEADEQEAEMWSSDSPRETAKRSVEIFGLTTDPREGGYILPNGKMLDFSGRAFGDTHVRGQRYLDHREVSVVLGEDDPGGTEGMVHFMKKAGAIRLGYHDDGVLTLDFATQPTAAQRQRIENLSRESTDLVWDITDYDPDSGEISVVDSGEGLATPSIRNEMLASTEQLDDPDVSLRTPRASRYLTERHYGPGPHPGTGTDQEVHAGDGDSGEEEGIERFPSNHPYAELWNRQTERRRAGKFTHITRDPDTGELIFITDRDVAIEYAIERVRDEDVEVSYTISQTEALSHRGDEDSIGYDADYAAHLSYLEERGDAITHVHNHPPGDVNIQAPPSKSDLIFYAERGIDEAFVVAGEKTYRLRHKNPAMTIASQRWYIESAFSDYWVQYDRQFEGQWHTEGWGERVKNTPSLIEAHNAFHDENWSQIERDLGEIFEFEIVEES